MTAEASSHYVDGKVGADGGSPTAASAAFANSVMLGRMLGFLKKLISCALVMVLLMTYRIAEIC